MAERRPISAIPRPEEIFARLEKSPVAPLYLFYGEESYLLEQAVMSVRKRMGPGTAVRTFYGGEDLLDQLLETWGARSLFAANSLIILKRADRLKAGERERLAREAGLRDATQPLVVCAHGRIDVSQKFFELCAKTGFVAEFRPPFANQIPAWVQRLARERKVRVTEEAATLIADLIGTDLFALAGEIDKLIAFIFPRTEIDVDAVTTCTGHRSTATVFDLADALGQRDRQRALGLLREVLTSERDAVPVLQALVGHFRRLWRVKELTAAGTPESVIERTIGLRGLRLRALLRQSQSFSSADLRRFFHQVAELDVTFKSTRLSPDALLDALILALCVRGT